MGLRKSTRGIYLALVVAVSIAGGMAFAVSSLQDAAWAQTIRAQTGIAAGVRDRTPYLQSPILYRLNDLSDCSAVAHSNLISVNKLTIRGAANPNSGDCDGLSNPTLLDINGDTLTSPPDGVFDEPTALESPHI